MEEKNTERMHTCAHIHKKKKTASLKYKKSKGVKRETGKSKQTTKKKKRCKSDGSFSQRPPNVKKKKRRVKSSIN